MMGDIIGQQQVAIAEDDTALSLFDKMNQAAQVLLADELPKIKAGTNARLPRMQRPPATTVDVVPRTAKSIGTRAPPLFVTWSVLSPDPIPEPLPIWSTVSVCSGQVRVSTGQEKAFPGTVLATNPLTVACGEDALIVEFGQVEDGVYLSGGRLAEEFEPLRGDAAQRAGR